MPAKPELGRFLPLPRRLQQLLVSGAPAFGPYDPLPAVSGELKHEGQDERGECRPTDVNGKVADHSLLDTRRFAFPSDEADVGSAHPCKMGHDDEISAKDDHTVLFQNSAERESAILQGSEWPQTPHSRSTWRVLDPVLVRNSVEPQMLQFASRESRCGTLES